MKKTLLLFPILLACFAVHSQVTQLNDNQSLRVIGALNNSLVILNSDVDSTLWVTDGTPGGTTQLSAVIKTYGSVGAVLNGKLIFKGTVAATGAELYITDGTPGGTQILLDINSGSGGSEPDDFILLNGVVYFTDSTTAEGRELWGTDGTPGGTALVKDITPGATGSFTLNSAYRIFSTGSFLLFAANTPASGNELWKSDGSGVGTVQLNEINTGNGNADSSNPKSFFILNGLILFSAKDATHGDEIWATDGTPGSTTMLKDINPGTGNSTTFEIFPGVDVPVFLGFHTFNNLAFFNATDGTSNGEIWSTDGTPGNTVLVKDVVSTTSIAVVAISIAENLSTKFIFPVSDAVSRSELWESDGTPGGTQLFQSFSPTTPGDIPIVFVSIAAAANGTLTYPLFQGNKFFFAAGTTAAGTELWITDGTPGGTHMVADLNPGPGDGIDASHSISYLYTANQLFFAVNNGTQGDELWKTDGTLGGTMLVQDIDLNAASADPELSFLIPGSGKILFNATEGNSATAFDLYAVDGTFAALPLNLTDFTVSLVDKDANLSWTTQQETNTKDFTIQRSWDAKSFQNIGKVAAAGNSSNRKVYTFKDAGVANSAQGLVYYQLLVTDIDGKLSRSKIISVNITGYKEWNVRMLSNPVGENVSVILSGIRSSLKLSVHDMSGRLVYTSTYQNLNGQVSLPVTLQKGVYLLDVEYNGERKVIRFVK